MKRGDILAILAVALVALLPLALLFHKGSGEMARVLVDGEPMMTLPLLKDGEFLVSTAYGENLVVVRDGEIFVESASCPDLSCVHQGAIHSPGQVIACLPNRLTITVLGEGDYDALTR